MRKHDENLRIERWYFCIHFTQNKRALNITAFKNSKNFRLFDNKTVNFITSFFNQIKLQTNFDHQKWSLIPQRSKTEQKLIHYDTKTSNLIFHWAHSGLDQPDSGLHGEDHEGAGHDPGCVVVLKLLSENNFRRIRSVLDDVFSEKSICRKVQRQNVVLRVVGHNDGVLDVQGLEVGQVRVGDFIHFSSNLIKSN